MVAVITLTAIIAVVIGWNLKPSEPRQVMRFYHELPRDQRFTNAFASLVDLSADGTKIVYVANQQLYLRDLKEPVARPIQGTNEIPSTPIFSPDGLWVAYYSNRDNQWKKIAASGGAPVILCDADLPRGGVTWSSDNTILFEDVAGIMRISVNGGTAELIIEQKESEQFHGPQALPGGEWVLFTLRSADSTRWDEAQIVVQSLKTGERKLLLSGGSDARYVPTGHLVYALGDVLYARAFDVDSLEVMGGAVSIVEGVQRAGLTGSANYGFSDTGMLAYVVGGADSAVRLKLLWVDRDGKEEPLGAESRAYRHPRISPNGTKVALTIDNGNKNDIWIWDVVNKNIPRLTFNEGSSDPVWTLDGKRIAFMLNNGSDVYWRAADGTGGDELIGSGPGQLTIPFAWSVDGKILVTMDYFGADNLSIGSISMEEDHPHKPLLQEKYLEMQPQISPDGRWMAYTSNESGDDEIYVRPFPDVNKGRRQVSQNGGDSPLWSPDGKELFYRKNDEVITVSVETKPTFKTMKSETLFRGDYVSELPLDRHTWDIHPDGKRFLMMKESSSDATTEEASRSKINIVVNWFEELKERVP